jgi:two-component system, cell cycle sensor histidine kinase and response regulator CckA
MSQPERPDDPPRTILFKMPRGTEPSRKKVAPVAPADPAGPSAPKSSPTIRRMRECMDATECKSFFQSLYDGILITDFQGRMVEVNGKACKLCRCSAEALLARNIADVVLGIRKDVLQSLATTLKSGRHVLVDSECLRMDGTLFACEVAVTPLHIAGHEQLCFSVRDITEREKAEQRLQEQEEELRMGEEQLRKSLRLLREREHELEQERDILQTLMDTIPDRIFLKDTRSRFQRVNKAMIEFLGATEASEIVGKTDAQFFEGGEALQFAQDDARVVAEGLPLLDKVQKIVGNDGKTHFSAVSKVPVRNRAGNIVGLVGVSRDVTARIQAEQNLEQARKKLERMERLEATALFAGQIAHDFNNLLVPLLVYPEMIKQKVERNSQIYNDLETIENTARQIADINQDLMALARRGKGQEQTLDVHASVQETVDAVRRSIPEKKIDIAWRPEAEQAIVKFDPSQLARVLHNLFQNAIDALDDGGQMVLQTENVTLHDPFGKYVQIQPGSYVKLNFRDNGCGIPADVRDRIFDPFFTTKTTGQKRGGSGLGLSVVYGIMSDHHGYIDVESEPGSGTTFSLYFPVCEPEAKKEVRQDVPGGNESVWLVEDESLHGDVVLRILTDLGYSVRVAKTGEELIAMLAAANGAFPDLLALDIVLGDGMDGVETFRKVRELNPSQKAITVSGLRDSAKVEEALAAGVARHLNKPLRIEPLARAVREILDG